MLVDRLSAYLRDTQRHNELLNFVLQKPLMCYEFDFASGPPSSVIYMIMPEHNVILSGIDLYIATWQTKIGDTIGKRAGITLQVITLADWGFEDNQTGATQFLVDRYPEFKVVAAEDTDWTEKMPEYGSLATDVYFIDNPNSTIESIYNFLVKLAEIDEKMERKLEFIEPEQEYTIVRYSYEQLKALNSSIIGAIFGYIHLYITEPVDRTIYIITDGKIYRAYLYIEEHFEEVKFPKYQFSIYGMPPANIRKMFPHDVERGTYIDESIYENEPTWSEENWPFDPRIATAYFGNIGWFVPATFQFWGCSIYTYENFGVLVGSVSDTLIQDGRRRDLFTIERTPIVLLYPKAAFGRADIISDGIHSIAENIDEIHKQIKGYLMKYIRQYVAVNPGYILYVQDDEAVAVPFSEGGADLRFPINSIMEFANNKYFQVLRSYITRAIVYISLTAIARSAFAIAGKTYAPTKFDASVSPWYGI